MRGCVRVNCTVLGVPTNKQHENWCYFFNSPTFSLFHSLTHTLSLGFFSFARLNSIVLLFPVILRKDPITLFHISSLLYFFWFICPYFLPFYSTLGPTNFLLVEPHRILHHTLEIWRKQETLVFTSSIISTVYTFQSVSCGDMVGNSGWLGAIWMAMPPVREI